MRNLFRYVVHKYATEWNDIAIELGLKPSTVKIIKMDNQKCEECFKEALQKWLEISPNATWSILEVAITNVKRAKESLDPITTVYGKKLHRCFVYLLTLIVHSYTGRRSETKKPR